MEAQRAKDFDLAPSEDDNRLNYEDQPYKGPSLAQMLPPPEMKFKIKNEWQGMADSLRGTFEGAFDALINQGWKGLMAEMKSMFKRTLAQMIADLVASGLARALAGLLPTSGTIGGIGAPKKTGFFGKLFGGGLFGTLASIGLSFIPGVGGLLSAASSVASGAGHAGVHGSHATGLPYVPFDNYVANLHRGERVMTARENQNFSGGLHPDHVALLQDIRAVLSRLQAVRPHDVVAMGAHGLNRAMDRDASLADGWGRRLNLAR
jgi:hypothetical protein